MIADLSSVARIPFSIHSFHLKTELEAKDIVFTKIGANIGDISILPSTEKVYNFSQNVAGAKIDRKKIMPEYLVCFLSTKYGRFQIKRIQMLSGQGKLELVDIKKILILPASYELQKNIADIYNLAENFLVLAKEQYVQAEQLLLSELGLRDWKPRHTLTYMRSFSQVAKASRMDAEHFYPKYKELREIIRNYSGGYLKLIDIAVNSNETIEPHANPEHDFEYIELADINQTIGVIENAKIIKGKDAPSRARMLLRNGDIIASSVEGSLDKVALVSEEYDGAIGSTGFFVLRPRTVLSGYLLALIKSIIVREQMHCEASGTILSAVPAKSLKNIIVPNIPPEKQDEISAFVQQSHAARREAKTLLEKAKRAVEIAIEEGEERAMEFLSR
jgi:type I restriction enzyme S subunit